MKFLRLTLENFRVFRDRIQVDFAHDKEKNVTLFIANNATGKTTLVQAIKWCLFGNCDLKGDLINLATASQMLKKTSAKVEVEVELEFKGTVYTFHREACFLKNQEGSIILQTEKGTFDCQKRGPEGGTRPIFNPADDEVRKAVPRKLERFIFFDGERIEGMSRNFQQKNNSVEIESAVSDLLGMRVWENAVRHLIAGADVEGVRKVPNRKPGFQCVSRYFENSYNKLIDSDKSSRLSQQIKDLQNEVDVRNCEVESLKDEVLQTELAITEFEDKIRNNDSSKEKQRQRDEFKSFLENSQSKEETLLDDLKKRFLEQIFDFASLKLSYDAIQLVESVSAVSDDVPGIDSNAIEYILKSGKCICGTPLSDSMRLKLEDLKQTIPPHSISGTLLHFIEWFKDRYQNNSSINNLRSELHEKLNQIRIEQNHQEEFANRLKIISDELGSSANFSALINEAENNRRSAKEKLNSLNQNIGAKNQQVREFSEQIKNLNNRLQNDAKVNGEARRLKLGKKYSDELGLMFCNKLEEKKKIIRDNLNAHIQRVFSELSQGDYIPSINQNYQFRCLTSDGSDIHELSSAQNLIAVLAVIAGIISLGREIIAEDEKQKDIIDTVPMVMDAPISSFDSDRVNSFSETIPQIAEQLILLLKNPEAEIVKIKMNKKIGKLYRITNSENGNSTCSVIEKLEA